MILWPLNDRPAGTAETPLVMHPVDDTRDLTRRIAKGDHDALADFYDRWFERVLAMARHGTRRDEPFCLDVVQETFLRAIRSMKPIPSERDLAAWLNRIAASAARDAIRKERRARERERAAATRGADRRRAAPDEPADLPAWTRAAMATLDPADANLILLRIARGWTLARIGAHVGLSPGAVDGRITRALARLRRAAPDETDATLPGAQQ